MNKLLIGLAVIIFCCFSRYIFYYIQGDNKPPLVKELPTFIEADKFSGSKEGYVFKMDSQGLGYYLDKQKI